MRTRPTDIFRPYTFIRQIFAGLIMALVLLPLSAPAARAQHAPDNFLAQLTGPGISTVISSSSRTFQWSSPHSDVDEFWLCVGSSSSSICNVYNQSAGLNTSVTVNNIPLAQHNIYVRLYTKYNSVWYHVTYTFPTTYGGPSSVTPPAMSSPSEGTVLTSASTTFNWAAGSGNITNYTLCLGTTLDSLVSTGDLGCVNGQTTYQAVFNNIPLQGKHIFARLWYYSGQWYYRDYTYPTANLLTQNNFFLTQPAEGVNIDTTSYTFQWDVTLSIQDVWVSAATSYELLGQSPYGDIYSASVGVVSSKTVNNIPLNGKDLMFRLWAKISNIWYVVDYALPRNDGRAQFISPTAGSTIGTSSYTFQWTTGTGVTEYWLRVATTPTGTNIFDQSVGTLTSKTVNSIPLNGNPVYVKLWSKIGGVWYLVEQTNPTASGQSVITSPVDGSTLSSPNVTFSWTSGIDVTDRAIWIGSTPGGSNYYSETYTSGELSDTINGIPLSGDPVYVRLRSKIGTNWLYSDAVYNTVDQRPVITSPAAGSTLSATTLNLQWTNYSAISGFQVDVGTTPTGEDIYAGTELSGAQTSLSVDGIGLTGQPVYVNFWYEYAINGQWVKAPVTIYNTDDEKPVFTSPAPGATLTSSSPTFSWSAHPSVTEYKLGFSTDPNIMTPPDITGWLSSGTATQQAVTGLPLNGDPVYGRLWYEVDGSVWYYVDVTYNTVANTAVPQFFSPGSAETTTINYTTGFAGNVTIIIKDKNGQTVRTLINAQPRPAGANAEVWNGRNDAGTVLPAGYYLFTITNTNGSTTETYNPVYIEKPIAVSGLGMSPASFEPSKGETAQISYSLNETAWVKVQLGPDGPGVSYRTLVQAMRPAGSHAEHWDGRRDDGTIAPEVSYGYKAVIWAETMNDNAIAIEPALASNQYPAADGYRIYPAYKETTEITYTVDVDCTHSLKIISPTGAVVTTLVNSTAVTAPYTNTVEWDGRKNGKIVAPGDYKIRLEMTDGVDTLVRDGNVTVLK